MGSNTIGMVPYRSLSCKWGFRDRDSRCIFEPNTISFSLQTRHRKKSKRVCDSLPTLCRPSISTWTPEHMRSKTFFCTRFKAEHQPSPQEKRHSITHHMDSTTQGKRSRPPLAFHHTLHQTQTKEYTNARITLRLGSAAIFVRMARARACISGRHPHKNREIQH